MNEPILSRIAIIILALVMAVFGVYHFIAPQNLLAYVPSFLPDAGNLWVYLPGAAFIFTAIALITRKAVKVACYILTILLLIFVITIHVPNYLNAGDADVRTAEFMNMLKDTAIAAFAMHVAANTGTEMI